MIYDRGLIMKRTRMAALSGVLGLAVSAAVLFASDAYAGNSDFLNGPQSVSGTGNDQNVTGNGSTGIYNNAAATSGTVTNSGNSRNTNTNKNSQGQSLTQIDTTPATTTVKEVPTVYAPGLTAAGTEVCLGSLSAGGAAAGFGLTVGGTMVDRECQLRLNAKTLAVLGYTVAAREEMCLDPEVRAAMLAGGTPCAADRAAPPQARAEYTTAVPQAAAQTSEPAAAPGCHKAYQLLGGWHDVCPPVAQAAAAYASADNLPAEAAAPTQETAAPGCRKAYQLIGGWYDKCD